MSVVVPVCGPSAGDPAGTSGAAPVLACYLVIDTSDSMSGPPLEAATAELARLCDAAREHPRLAAGCRLAVVTFDAEARVHLPLTPAAELPRPPRLGVTRPATDFAAAFSLLRRQIAADLAALRGDELRPVRPAVFLFTDGRPTRGYWPAAHAALTDPAWPDAPDVVVFGFGDAAPLAIGAMGTAGTYLAAGTSEGRAPGPAGLLATFVAFLLASLATAGGGSRTSRLAPALPREQPLGRRPVPAHHRGPDDQGEHVGSADRAATTRSATAAGASPSVCTTTSATSR